MKNARSKPSKLLAVVVVLVIASIAASTVTSLAAQPKNTSNKEANYAPDQILVRFKPSIAANAAVYKLASDAASASINATVIKQYSVVPGLEVVKLPSGLSVTDAITHYQTNGNVAYAEPDYIATPAATATLPASSVMNDSGYTAAITPDIALPNDPYYQYQWAFPDMNASGAWNKTTGSTSTIIADVDTGADATHPDLAANLLPQYNAAPELVMDSMHGTHTAGIIGAVGNNSIGITGTNWRTSILPVVALNATGGYYSDIISAWQYAASNGATIINNSFGGTGYSQAMNDTINACPQCLFVCAAGNNASNNDVSPFYPASLRDPNIISVAAINSDDSLASFSNYGATTVNLGAPGVGILSTIWWNTTGTVNGVSGVKGYDTWDGTSMATPYVTGVAGLIKTVNPSLSVAQIRNAILNNVDPDSYLSGLVSTGGKLDAAKAVDSVTATLTPTLSPAVTAQNANSLDLFMRGSDGALWYKYWTGTTWTASTSLGGVLTSAPAATSPANGAMDVFVQGSDNALWWQNTTDNGTTWSGWKGLGGVLGSAPAVTSSGSAMSVFVRGTDGALWWQNTTNSGTTWSGWKSLSGVLGSAPAATSSGSGAMAVFVQGSDNGLWWQNTANSGTTWSGWKGLGGVLGSAPAATSSGSGAMAVFVHGRDNGLWWQNTANSGTTWSGWKGLGGVLITSPAATSPANGAMDVFVLGSDNGLWWQNTANSGTMWSGWTYADGI
ncbi:MAG: S8 family serine peptidase [Halobacteriota archaeon]|jgi:subtilisin family serine protease